MTESNTDDPWFESDRAKEPRVKATPVMSQRLYYAVTGLKLSPDLGLWMDALRHLPVHTQVVFVAELIRERYPLINDPLVIKWCEKNATAVYDYATKPFDARNE